MEKVTKRFPVSTIPVSVSEVSKTMCHTSAPETARAEQDRERDILLLEEHLLGHEPAEFAEFASSSTGPLVAKHGAKRKRSASSPGDFSSNPEPDSEAPVVQYLEKDECTKCQVPRILDSEQAILVCPRCAHSIPYMDSSSNAMAYGEEVEFTVYLYQRANYFNEYLSNFQGKESTKLNEQDIQKVARILYHKYKIRDKSQIKVETIRDIVTDYKLGLSKQVSALWSRLTGLPCPRLSQSQEKICRNMFLAIQAPFEKYCPPTKKRMCSYPYILYKFCQLLGWDEFLDHFPLLKDPAKLRYLENLWRKICKDLDWQFIPVPATPVEEIKT